MSRKGPSKKHQLLPDPIYGSTVVAQLINKILLDGKKSIAEDIVYSALDMVKEKTDQSRSPFSSALWTTSVRPSRFAPAVSVALPTGPGRSEAGPRQHAVPALAHRLLPRPSREDHG